jgi:hypothetical protein
MPYGGGLVTDTEGEYLSPLFLIKVVSGAGLHKLFLFGKI